MISLGWGYYDFSFSSLDDMRSVYAVGAWNLHPGFLRLYLWTPDFNPALQKFSHVQCWVKIVGLPQEFWSPRIIFSIAGGIGTPISLDEATNNRTFRHFARVLVDIDLKTDLPNQILVEREGHLVTNCRKRMKEVPTTVPLLKKKQVVEKVLKKNTEKDFVINLEIDHNEEVNLQNVTGVEDTPMAQHFDSETVQDMAYIDETVVEDSLVGLEQNASIGAKDPLVGIELNEAVEFQVVEEMNNPRVDHDMRLFGRLLDDEGIDEEVDDESRFTAVISRSQKKKQKKKDKLEKLRIAFLNGFGQLLSLKLFFMNDRGALIPSIWGLCKLHLAPTVISNSFHKVSMVVSVEGKDLFIAAVYGTTSQMLRRALWEELKLLILANHGPWCCLGDFNVVLGIHECRGMRLTPTSPCADFKNFIDSSNLIRLQTKGASFTWSNRR
ncbi:PREDICTED: uncharacterized protein LOC109339680 [Lupinus angustifolius]|uniref:uncharacterized protein LOC109339680 n=1 Tax=Lupinus angustifolius TaxID=3871 RepID=UPI00092EE089|nr:PREDICTED: uncharacterized protein LOC109339680 [Lupinus angustifolius]